MDQRFPEKTVESSRTPHRRDRLSPREREILDTYLRSNRPSSPSRPRSPRGQGLRDRAYMRELEADRKRIEQEHQSIIWEDEDSRNYDNSRWVGVRPLTREERAQEQLEEARLRVPRSEWERWGEVDTTGRPTKRGFYFRD